MGKLIKYILFRTVLIVITLHTIIPHPHANELTVAEHLALHKKSHSLIGIIEIAFHESDDERLDTLIFAQYESVKKLDYEQAYSKILIATTTTPSFPEKSKTVKIVEGDTDNFNNLLFVKLNGLRGPPQLI